MGVVDGVKMELDDCAFPLLTSQTPTPPVSLSPRLAAIQQPIAFLIVTIPGSAYLFLQRWLAHLTTRRRSRAWKVSGLIQPTNSLLASSSSRAPHLRSFT